MPCLCGKHILVLYFFRTRQACDQSTIVNLYTGSCTFLEQLSRLQIFTFPSTVVQVSDNGSFIKGKATFDKSHCVSF